jgi:hypothetical protein
MKKYIVLAVLGAALLATPAYADGDEIAVIRQEIQAMKKAYESRISELENKLAALEEQRTAQTTAETVSNKPTAVAQRKVYENVFNPSIGVIMDAKYQNFSESLGEIAGFGVAHEGERGRSGLALDESELNFSANVDDKFYGSLTAAVVREGGSDQIELEEAYVKTQGGVLPYGFNVKAGRAFWALGYMNEHHTHGDDFADRALPYRAFLNKAFNDDGVEVSWLLPTDFYSEIGGGMFRGDDFPSGTAGGNDANAWSAFARVGGDIGVNQSWRLGASMLSTDTSGRSSNEDTVTFIGESDLYITDLRYTWAPTGNARNEEVTLQGEYFWRNEDGTYEDTGAATGAVNFDDNSNGWYAQATYKFHPQWRVGARYSRLGAANAPAGLVGSALDAGGHDPYAYAAMIDWTNSEFSRIRLQVNQEEVSRGVEDTQFILQYTMSLGAHGAHKY